MKNKYFLFFLFIYSFGFSQSKFTFEDSLRGSITPERAWWDLQYYSLNVKIEPIDKFISGFNLVKYKVLTPSQTLQIDLQAPMLISRVEQGDENLSFSKKGNNAYFIRLKKAQIVGEFEELKVYFSGKPMEAKRAPWDGGFSWTKDGFGKDFQTRFGYGKNSR